MDKIGLERYERCGKKLKEVANYVLTEDGYKVDLDRPIGAGKNGVVFEGIDSKGNNVAIKLCSSCFSALKMTREDCWNYGSNHHTTSYDYLGELEIVRRFVSREIYEQSTFKQFNGDMIKVYRPVDLGDGLPKIRALYRAFELENEREWCIITVMDWVEGEDLETYTDKNSFDAGNVLDWILKILKALKPLRDRGWVHMDLDPSNIVRREDGSLCIIDLGKAIDWYDRNKDVETPYYNVEFIKGRNLDQDLLEIKDLVCGVFKSKQYNSDRRSLHECIMLALEKSNNCRQLYDSLAVLLGK